MADKKFKLRVPAGYDIELDFVTLDPNEPVGQNEDNAVPIEEDDQGNLAWNGCGCD
jgi:hypothetical protein